MRFVDLEREKIFAGKLIEQKELLVENITLDKVTAHSRKRIDEPIIEGYCSEYNRMAAIPPGAFAVVQVRKNLDRPYPAKFYHEEENENQDNKNTGFNAKVLQEGRELTPLKYNSKLMNSIWGLYNRYSVHNFKKIDANNTSFLAWGLNPTEATVKGPVITAGH